MFANHAYEDEEGSHGIQRFARFSCRYTQYLKRFHLKIHWQSEFDYGLCQKYPYHFCPGCSIQQLSYQRRYFCF